MQDVTLTGINADGLRYDVTLTLSFAGGRYVCTALNVQQRDDGEPISSDGLRYVPIAKIVAAGMREHFQRNVTEALDAANDVERAARVYRLAYACGLRPTTTVAATLGIALSTAGKKVLRARQLGLLGATSWGKAGIGV